MPNKIISPEPLWQNTGLAILRIIAGLLMTYHGWEVFDAVQINEYAKWDSIKTLPQPLLMAYFGKGLELITGILLTVGLLTRMAALFMAIIMLFVCFKIGNGRFYYEDQHPFVFAMLAIVFFFTGPVKWSVDHLIFKSKGND